jgi:sec-independent protein translocase protein TatA
MNLGPTELMLVLAVVLVLFGGAKLPKLARSMGQAQKEFRSGVREGVDSHDAEAEATS